MTQIRLALFGLIILLFPFSSTACSMYKLTRNGKTIVGNNEDYLTPNNQFWFEPAGKGVYGVMYMGQLDGFAQGAINEAGLVFDGFYESYLAIKNSEGKKEIPIQEAIKNIMQQMSNVEEVKSYLETINLSSLTNSQIVFVDKSGTYLIIEGDELIIGDEPEKTFSNFYYSQIDSLKDVTLDYFQSGQEFISTTESKCTLDYCGEAMQKFSQSKIAATQYTTIYDLNTLKIRIYLFHDYSQFVEIDLKKELVKGNRSIMVAELFPKESIGYKHYIKYNNPEDPLLFIKEAIGDAEISEEQYKAMGFDGIISKIGYEWIDLKKDTKGAINVFKFGVALMPNDYALYNGLAEAYFFNGDMTKALNSYEKSLALNPDNEKAKEMISKIQAEN